MLASGAEVVMSRLFVKFIFLLVSVVFQKHILVQYTPDISRYLFMHLHGFLSLWTREDTPWLVRECDMWSVLCEFFNPWKSFNFLPLVLCYRSKIVVAQMGFLSLAVLEVVIMTTSSGTDDGNFVGMAMCPSFPYRCYNHVIYDCDISGGYSLITMSIKSD